MEEIIIMDYQNNKTAIAIPNMDDVLSIRISVFSGDEVLYIVHNDGNEDEYDSSGSRFISFFDGRYELYNRLTGVNHLHDDKFLNRHTTYSYFLTWEDEEEAD